MKEIWKFPLSDLSKSPITILSVPVNYKILNLQIDQKTGYPCVWILVDIRNPLENIYLRVVATGQEINADIYRYVGTFQLDEGLFVGHVFEKL